MTEPAIDTGEILEALNDKVDRDCRNVDTTSGADVVIEWQAPTSANNYTWYRKYKSGWVEQGGKASISNSSTTITLLKNMADTNYLINVSCGTNGISGSNYFAYGYVISSTTVSSINVGAAADSHTYTEVRWEVKGFTAQN